MKSILLIALVTIAQGAVVPMGLGSYSDQLPASVVAPTNNDGVYLAPAITSSFQGPIPTNDWASSLVFQRNPGLPHPHSMFPHPWVVRADSTGLCLGTLAGVGISASAYVFGTSWDLTVAIPNVKNQATKLNAHSDWTVQAGLYNNALKATFGHGLPYVYIDYQGPIAIQLPGTPTVQSNQNGVIAFSIGDRRYAAYASSSNTWTVQGQSLQSNLSGFLSIATLPDTTQATRSLFLEHAYAFVSNTQVSWAYDSTQAKSMATYEFITQIKQGSNSNTLFALYPHQWRNASTVSLTGREYRSPRGAMKLASGSQFSTQSPLPGLFPIVPFAAPQDLRYQANTMQALLQEWSNKTDAQLVRRNADTYWTGKDLGRLAILTQLADASGNTTLRNRFLTVLRSNLEDWLTYTPGETNEYFAYEPTWKTLIGLGASYGSANELNDHHFHYGYYIMAAATVARFVSGWGNEDQWGSMVNLIVQEVSNPSRTSNFSPFLRTFDVYAGHSWASGHANFGDGNNQESSSESLNFSAGLIQWAMVTGNHTLRDVGIYLYATEVQAVREYWFDVHDQNFPATWSKNTAGMVWGGKVDYGTWFSAQPEMIHGINMLPITGSSLFLGMDPDYANANYNLMLDQNGGEATEWPDVIWEYRAFSNVEDAWRLYNANPNYTPEDGESKAHTYSHILSISALGALDTAIRGDLPTSAVFRKGNTLTYTAYNPTASPRMVRFTNGQGIQVEAMSWAITDQASPVVVSPRSLSHYGKRIKAKVFDLLGRRE